MNVTYTLKNNKKIGAFLWSDFLCNQNWRRWIDIWKINDDGKKIEKEFELPVHDDENGVFIIYDGEKIYLNNYDYLPYSEVVAKVNECVEKKDAWLISNDSILATFIKETDKIGIVGKANVFDIIIPELGFGTVSDKTVKCLMIPTEKRYKKHDWHYKFTMEVYDDALRDYVANRDIYFMDFCSLLKSGYYRLVDKNEYTQEK